MRTLLAMLTALMLGPAGQPSPQDRTPPDLAAVGPRVGSRVPDFSLPDQDGRVRTLQSILGPDGALLVFFRSAEW